MPPVRATTRADIRSALTQIMEQQGNHEEALDKVAGKIVDTLVEVIKGMQTTCTSGLVAPPMGGPVTGTFQYVIS